MIPLALLLFATRWPMVQERQVREAVPAVEARDQLSLASLARDIARAAPSGALSPSLSARAEALGLTLLRDGDVAALLEPAPPWRGAGVMLVRLGPLSTELILQAPHPTSDLKSGEIVAQLFDAGSVRAAIFATTHRDIADAAHERDGPLQQLTLGLAEGLPNPLFVQIHGFAAETSSADAVVAVGLGLSDDGCAAQQIGAALLAPDTRTGAAEPQLAATMNAQSLLLRGMARFLHVELSKPLREGLVQEPTRQALLLETLLALASGAQCGGQR